MDTPLEGATVARAMPEMKNLDEVRGFIDLVVDQDWGVYELADAGCPSTGLPMYGKLLKRSTWFRMAAPNRSAVAGNLAQE